MGRLAGRLFVGFTLCLISFIAYSSQIFIIWPWYGRVLSIELLTLLVPFNFLVGMLLWNYYLCVTTDPGGVPRSWRPDLHDLNGYEVKKLTRGPRYCRTCESYKPPRSHHCRQYHHCPWVNNCVGHFNYGHFIRFLFYVDLACSYHLAMVTRRVYSTVGGRYWDEPSGRELIFIVLNYASCIPVLLAVGGFSIYHFYALMGNSTTIEGWEKDKAATLVRRGKIRENLGVKRNISSMLGSNPLLWCCPSVPPGNGLKYPLAEGDDSIEEAWPPRDPNAYVYPDEDPDHKFTLPDSPWTYQNGSLNPELHPSNSRLSSSSTRRRKKQPDAARGAHSSVPPYHPDYNDTSTYPSHLSSSGSAVSSGDEDYYEDSRSARAVPVRRGSEGYEVQPIDRELLLRRYIEDRTTEPGRYQRYIPDPPSDADTDDDEQIPLAEKVEMWRTAGS
ncbi:Palmitoyltransferase PFA4, partial [Grifola frondosa]